MLRVLFFALIVRPLTLVFLGVHLRGGTRLPQAGPALIVANHNSHLDTLVLLSLFPLGRLAKVRAAGAADYFFKNAVLSWIATRLIGIIPVARAGKGGNPLAAVMEALRAGQIVIIFPEGSRGEAERLGAFKRGITVLGGRFPEVPVIPVFLHGLGKALPKGDFVLVPFFCDIFVGEGLKPQEASGDLAEVLFAQIQTLAAEARLPVWD